MVFICKFFMFFGENRKNLCTFAGNTPVAYENENDGNNYNENENYNEEYCKENDGARSPRCAHAVRSNRSEGTDHDGAVNMDEREI